MVKKRAIVFVDGNNWYHNVKSVVNKPRSLDFQKLSNLIAEHFDLDIREIRYYNSTPDIGLGEENYYKHMVFLAGLKKKGLEVNTNKLKKVKVNGKIIRVEKGIDVMIAVDMINKTLIDDDCDPANAEDVRLEKERRKKEAEIEDRIKRFGYTKYTN